MKFSLLLIPLLFFMTSCTIDWNDEKDKKITELAKQIYELERENTDKIKLITELQTQNRELFFSGNLLEIRNAECRGNLEYSTKN
jgi:hypothetical protein